jgi:arylsulfatase A
MRTACLRLLRYVLLLGYASCSSLPTQKVRSGPPNLVFILIDDLGIEATNSYGSEGLVRAEGTLVPYKQPHMEAFAAQGMTFTRAFATPSCAPSRAQFLTGRYPFRTGIIWPTLPMGPLADEEITLAEVLRERGYRTGMAGKWNLRHGMRADEVTLSNLQESRDHAISQGFDVCEPFVSHTIEYGEPTPEEGYQPYKTNLWACEFVQQAAAAQEPFYLQYSLGLVHGPYGPTPLQPELDGSLSEQQQRELNYLSMLEYTDLLIGKLLQRIDDLGLAGNTLVLLAGDNGSNPRFTSSFRGEHVLGGKLGLKDSGSRVPFCVRWPAVVAAGSQYEGLTDFSDIFSTFIEVAGASVPASPVIDGRSFATQLAGGGQTHRDFVFCQMRDLGFVSDGEYKLLPLSHRDMRAGLYRVSDDLLDEQWIDEQAESPQEAQARQRLVQHFEDLQESMSQRSLGASDASP